MRRLSGCRPGSPPESCHATPAGARRPDPSPTLDLAHVAARRPAGGDDAGRRRHRSRERLTRPVAALARRAAAGLGALAALLLVSGLLAVPGGAARAQTGHWSAAMTVGNSGSSYGYTGIGTGYGALTTTGFTIAGTAYTVLGLVHSQTDGTGVNLLLDTALGADGEGLTLELDDSSFDFDDATVTSVTIRGTGGTRYFWAASSPGWAAGDEVAARIAGSSPALTRAPGAVPLASPTITDIAVTDTPTTGSTAYGANVGIELSVTFSEAVLAVFNNDPPSFTVNVGGTNRQATFSSNDSSTPMAVQTFFFSVQTGDEDPDGISIDAGSIALNGATIQNGSGEDAILSHGAFSFPDAKVDGVFPTFDSAEIDTATDATALVLTFSETLRTYHPGTGPELEASDFSVSVDGTANTVTAFAIAGSTLTLTLTDAVAAGATGVTVSYTAQSGLYNEISDQALNDVDSFTDVSVDVKSGAAQTVPGAPPSLTATADGTGTIILEWTAPASSGGATITGYKIEWSADGTTNWADLVANTGSAAVTYSDAMLDAGTTRHYRVSAINSVGAGAASSVASTTTDVPVTVTVAETLSTLEDEGAVEIVVTATTGIDAQPPRSFELGPLAIADGTATAGSDYIAPTIPIAFAVNDFSRQEIAGVFRWQATQSVLAPIFPDTDIEGDETFTATLVRPADLSSAITLGMHETVTVTIVNDDGTDATLSGLVLNDGTNDLALTPTFATDTTSYAASVGNAVSQITVDPETTDTGATVAYFDASDTEIDDADGAATGHQVGLDVGANVIKVTVTAEDTMTTETYTVVVTRAAVSATTPTVTGIAVSNSPLEGATAFGSAGAVGNKGVLFTVTFSEAVVVNWDTSSSSGPRFTVNVGGTNRPAGIGDNDSSTPMTVQEFLYTVVLGNEDPDGISIDAGSIALDGGTIQNGSGEDATLTHGAFSFPDAKVDGVFPTFDSAKIYTATDDTALVLTFSETLNAYHPGTVRELLASDFSVSVDGTANTVTAFAISGSTVTLTLTDAVAADATGVTVSYTQTGFVYGRLKDQALNPVATFTNEGVSVTTGPTTPTVSSVAITSTPPDTEVADDDTYAIGDKIEATVTFSEAVDVTGAPQLELQIGNDARQAAYSSGDDSAALVFSYTVVENDVDTDGIAIDANKLVLNGGTIAAVSGGLAANLAHGAEAADSGHKVDGVRPTLESAEGFAGSVELKYSEPLQAFDLVGAGGVTVKINGTDATILFVSVTEASNDYFTVGFHPDVSEIRYGDTVTVSYTPPASNPVRDLAGNTAGVLTDEAVENQTLQPAAISSVALSSDPGTDATYGAGEEIVATVTFDRPVKVDGDDDAPSLELDVGGTARQAAYSSGSGDAELLFSYTVVAGDEDADGVSIGENKLEDEDEAIFHSVEVDGVDNFVTANIDHNAVPDDAGHKVDGVAPTVVVDGAVIDVTSDANALVLTWSEPLDADSAPDQAQFAVDFDGTDNAVTAVDIDGSTLTLTLTTAATATTANVTVDYTKPETDFLTDAPGNAADGFTGRAVTVKSGPPTVSIAADADSVNEGEAAAFTLSRTGSAVAALTVNVSVTQEGDFIAGTKPTTVTFGAGDATVALEIATVDDDVGEDDGSIEATVTSVPSGIEISQTAASAKVAVKDKNDTRAKISVDRAAVTVKESAGTVTLGFSARMEPNVTPFAMKVALVTQGVGTATDATAEGGEDYEPLSVFVTFAATAFQMENGRWVADKTRNVTINNNHAGRWEGDETFEFKVQRDRNLPGSVAIVDVDGNVTADLSSTTTVTIAENQARPVLSLVFDPPNVDEGETATLKAVSASGVAFADDQTVTLTFGGTATKGTDFTVSSETLTLDAGKTSVATTVEVLSDTVDDEYETIVATATHGTRTFTATLGIGAAAPEAPAKVEATGYNGHAKLAWTKPAWDGGTPILRYEYRVAPAGAWTYLGWPQPWMTADIQLEPGEYGFDVRAVNAVGPGPWTGPATARVWPAHERPEGAPSAPQNLAVTSVTDTRADLEWFRPASYGDAPIRGFRVETCVAGCESESGWSELTADTGEGGTAWSFEWSHRGVTGGLKDRWYRVSAVTGTDLESAPSVPARHPGATIGVPGAGVRHTGATVWVNLENPDGRTLHVRLTHGSTVVETRTLTASRRSLGVAFENLEMNTRYTAQVDFAATFDSPAVREVGFSTLPEWLTHPGEDPFKGQTVEVSTDGGSTWGASAEIAVKPGEAASYRVRLLPCEGSAHTVLIRQGYATLGFLRAVPVRPEPANLVLHCNADDPAAPGAAVEVTLRGTALEEYPSAQTALEAMPFGMPFNHSIYTSLSGGTQLVARHVAPVTAVVDSDEDPVRLTVADASAHETHDAALEFVLELDRAADWPVTLAYTTRLPYLGVEGAATPGLDYETRSGTLTFAPGETRMTVSVPVVDDTVEDSGERMRLRVHSVVGAALAQALPGYQWVTATGTIYNTEEDVLAALTARVEGVPLSHDGQAAFGFDLHFSEEFGLSFRTLRDAAFEVTGGTVTEARRLARGSNAGWRIEVEPATDGTVTVVLAAGRACGESGAVCTGDGRKLESRVELRVAGPSSPAELANTAPEGLPVIAGTARVGETLSASAAGIADADGLVGATFAWQWLAGEDGVQTPIAGATGPSYTPGGAEEGKPVRVRVTFTDGGGTEETLVSAATAAVAAAVAPEVSIAAALASVTEGTVAVFTLSRTGPVAGALTVAVEVSESGAMVAGTAPGEAVFEAGSATAALAVGTEDDASAEAASEVTAALAAGAGYTVAASGASASVTVADNDEAPAAAPEVTTAPALEAAENATAVATLQATDADTAVEDLVWSLAGGADGDAFALTAGGVLSFAAAKDFEAPDDADADGVYEVTVRVSDGANGTEAPLAVTLTDVDDTAPALAGATVNGTVLTLAFDEALDGASAPPAGAFAVEVEGAARAVETVALEGSTATLILAAPAVAAGETVTVGYTPPAGAGAMPLRDAAGNAVAGFAGTAVTNEAVNAAPTGLPLIAGTARVGETLSASADGIEDADGLAGAAFAWQWVSSDGSTDSDIEEATQAAYTVAAADFGRALKVRVTFTDGGGTQESLESEATAAVEPAAAGPEVSVAAVSSPVTEGAAAAFTLSRGGDAAAALTVAVRVSEAGAVLAGAAPAAVTFEAGASQAALTLATLDDGAGEADARVTATVVPGADYRVAAGAGSAAVDVFDNDAAPSAPAVIEVWSGDLAVADFGTDGGYGTASADGFSNAQGSAAVQMRWLWYWAPERTLYMALARPLADSAELTLHLGDVTVALADGGSGNSFTWTGVDLDWAGGETVAVRLTKEGDGAVETPSGAAVSVADAQVREAAGAVLAFRVRLNAAQTTAVSVRYATSDGTAAAGSDYVAGSGAVRFEPGATERTVHVRVLEDAHDEGAETMTLVLSGAYGAAIVDGRATGTITNSDPVPQAWIARFGRTVTGQVLDMVEARLKAPRRAGMEATLAGQALPRWDGSGSGAGPGSLPGAGDKAPGAALGAGDRHTAEEMWRWMARAGSADDRWRSVETGGADGPGSVSGAGPGSAGIRSREVTPREFLTGSSFALSGGSAESGGYATLWGRGAVARFDGRDGGLTLDGEVTTGLIGADWAAKSWTAGLAVGHSTGTGGYRGPSGAGKVEATLTGVYPYAGFRLTERRSAWAAAGYGSGELTLKPKDGKAISTDLTMAMGAAGMRNELLRPGDGGGFALALKGDARFTRTSSEAARGADGGRLAAADADVWLLRTGIEGSRRFALGKDGGASMTPSFEIGARLDGGDAETGLGADLGGGLAVEAPETGLTLDLKARGLIVHEASGFREWGASAALSFDPRPSTDRGLALSLRQSWGASPSGGMDALLGRETLGGLAADPGSGAGVSAASGQGRLEAELGYGVAVFGGAFTGTPNLGFGMSAGARDYRLGWRLTSAVPGDPGFEVNLDATRRETTGGAVPAEHGVALKATIRW